MHTSLRRRVLVLAAGATLVASGCAARFERPEGSGPNVVGLGPGDQVDPDTGLPLDQGGAQPSGVPSATAGPGATGGPGTTPGTGGSTAGPGGVGATAGPGGSLPPGGGGGGGPGTVDPGRRTGISATTIKVAYLIPKTGAAPVPPQVDQGIQTYWRYVNDRGGVIGRNVQVTIYDTESDEGVARVKAQSAIDDGNFTVVALDRLGVQAAIGKYLDDRDVPNIMVQTPVGLSSGQQWTFGITIDHGVQGRLIAQYFRRALKYDTAAVVYELDSELKAGVATFRDEAGKIGLNVVYETQIDGQANDYSGVAAQLAEKKADAAWLYMAPIPAGKLASQADAIGYKPTWFANSVSWNFDIMFLAAGPPLQNARAFSPWPPLTDPRTATYRQAYDQYYDDPPLDLGIPGWGIGQILSTAFLRAGPTMGQNSFRHAMQTLQLSGPAPVDKSPLLWAPISFGAGMRTGATKVVTFAESGDRWTLERDYGSRY